MVPDLLVVSIVELMGLQFAENCGHTLLERGHTPLIVKVLYIHSICTTLCEF